jgi:hypothetical protein
MVRSMLKSLSFILLSTVLVSQASTGGEKLRYQMSKGTTYRYKLTSDNSTRIQQMGQEFAISSGGMFGVSLTVEDVGKDGELTCVGKVDTNFSRIDSPMMKDTALVFKEVNGKRSRLTFTALGRTLNAVPIDTVQQTQAMAMLGGLNVTDILRRLLIELPEQPIGAGESWKRTRPDTANVQGIKLITKPDIKYTVVGNEKISGFDCVKISVDGTSSQYGSGSVQGMEIVFDGTVKTKGTMYFAPKQGILVSVESTSSGDSNVSGTGEQMFTRTQTSSTVSKIVLVK